MDSAGLLDWQIAVFCQNERSRIVGCLKSISAAVGSRRALITLVVNGTSDGSDNVAGAAASQIGTPIQIFRIEHGDKSHAINSFIHDQRLRAAAKLHFFVDGCVRIHSASLRVMAECLSTRPLAVAATGIATTGRSEPQVHAATLREGGVLHGQFYALTGTFVNRIKKGGIRLPIGLYRGDGLLGSMAAHDLDCLHQPWINQRLISVPAAKFQTDPLSPFRFQDLRRQFRRKVQQMRGKLENAAIKKTIYARGYQALPRFADDLIREFLSENPIPGSSLIDKPFMALALRQLWNAKPPSPEALKVVRLA